MAVMEREAWTDERLDDLANRMDKGFDEVKVEIRDLRAHTDKGFDEVKGEVQDLRSETKAEFRELRVEMNTRFDSLHRSFDSFQRTLFLGAVTMSASIVGALIVVSS